MAFVQENWMLILVMVISGVMLVLPFVQRRMSPVKDVGNAEATRLINRSNAVLLDVREAKEFEGGHLPNAVHIPLSQLGERVGEMAKMTARPVIVYCDSGRRSRSASGALERAGFKEIYALDGGVDSWKKDGLPLAK